jgi:hypothetical protein
MSLRDNVRETLAKWRVLANQGPSVNDSRK